MHKQTCTSVADKIAPAVAQGVINQRSELRACEARYAARFADEDASTERRNKPALRYFHNLDDLLCRKWKYDSDPKIFVGNVHKIILDDMRLAERTVPASFSRGFFFF